MSKHTQAVVKALLNDGQLFEGNDEGQLAYFLKGWFDVRMEEDWIDEHIPAWVEFTRVNWADVARIVLIEPMGAA